MAKTETVHTRVTSDIKEKADKILDRSFKTASCRRVVSGYETADLSGLCAGTSGDGHWRYLTFGLVYDQTGEAVGYIEG